MEIFIIVFFLNCRCIDSYGKKFCIESWQNIFKFTFTFFEYHTKNNFLEDVQSRVVVTSKVIVFFSKVIVFFLQGHCVFVGICIVYAYKTDWIEYYFIYSKFWDTLSPHHTSPDMEQSYITVYLCV